MTRKKIVYVDMDGTLCDFLGAFHRAVKNNPGIKFPQSQYRFWANLEPITGAIEAYRELEKKFDVYILTAPSTRNPLCYTEKIEWVQNYLGFETLKKVIICKNKSLLLGDYLIDDRKVNGAGKFTGELILIHGKKFPTWQTVLDYLNEI